MEVITNPERKHWKRLTERSYGDNSETIKTVTHIIEEVRSKGDEALKYFTRKFTGADQPVLEVDGLTIKNAGRYLDESLKKAIQTAAENIQTFHAAQMVAEEKVVVMPGVECWRKSAPIGKVGLYIPGGTAPLFSTVLMLGIPAKLAGCKEIILCTPANKDGEIHPAILFSASLVGITRIFAVGGAQAIAAMAFGTESIPAADKIFGPGNQYVTTAKQLVQMQGVSIDMPAGPSELMIIADSSADPSFLASDLLSQAEHGTDSQVILLSTDAAMVDQTNSNIKMQLDDLPRKDIAEKVIQNSRGIIFSEMEEAISFANAYAAEHLMICTDDALSLAEKISNAGSVFIGSYSPESAGDYASGTNHTLPTNGFARAYSGVSTDSFIKKITYQQLSKQGLFNLSETIIQMAEAEGLDAHARAIKIRLNK